MQLARAATRIRAMCSKPKLIVTTAGLARRVMRRSMICTIGCRNRDPVCIYYTQIVKSRTQQAAKRRIIRHFNDKPKRLDLLLHPLMSHPQPVCRHRSPHWRR